MERANKKRIDRTGFTIVELLIVIVVIAILASVTIVAYNGIQNRAAVSALMSDLRNAAGQLEMDRVSLGTYPTQEAFQPQASPNVSLEYLHSASDNTYCLIGTSSRNSVPTYTISSDNPTVREGTCPGLPEPIGDDDDESPVASEPTIPAGACFQFNSLTHSITGYYTHENNNPGGAECPRDVILPAAINGTSVNMIGASAFSGANLTSLVIPISLTSLGANAFRDNQLTSVVISGPISSIASGAFRGNQIISVVISGTVTSIATDSFSYNQIASLTVTGLVTSIGAGAFTNNQLTSVSLPQSTVVNSSAFDSGVTVTRH